MTKEPNPKLSWRCLTFDRLDSDDAAEDLTPPRPAPPRIDASTA